MVQFRAYFFKTSFLPPHDTRPEASTRLQERMWHPGYKTRLIPELAQGVFTELASYGEVRKETENNNVESYMRQLSSTNKLVFWC